jgi:hypothetical protein
MFYCHVLEKAVLLMSDICRRSLTVRRMLKLGGSWFRVIPHLDEFQQLIFIHLKVNAMSTACAANDLCLCDEHHMM